MDARLIVLVVVPAVLKFGEALPNLLDPGSLFLQFLGVHFDMNGTTHEEAVRHFETIDFLDHLPSQEAADKRLGFYDRVYWVLVIDLLISCFRFHSMLCHICFLRAFFVGIVRTAISHLFLIKYLFYYQL